MNKTFQCWESFIREIVEIFILLAKSSPAPNLRQLESFSGTNNSLQFGTQSATLSFDDL